MSQPGKKLGLYIHIPFCKAKCHYCDFNSHPGMEAFAGPYFIALEKEATQWAALLEGETIGTVFIGGGTPSLVDSQWIAQMMDFCIKHFNISPTAEISLESNPGTLSLEKLKQYRACGINRLSIGVQACQDRLLQLLGRIHSRREFDRNYELAREAGFDNINLDLMFGLPGQTFEEWKETLEFAVRPGVKHLSCYSLKIEEGTVFGRLEEEGKLAIVDEELDRRMYAYTVEYLSSKGFRHYELSNFALPGFECRHNLVYWKAEEYVGLGAGAHSYIGGERFHNPPGIEEYIAKAEKLDLLRQDTEPIDTEESMSEFMILGLRLMAGVGAAEFEDRYGRPLREVYGAQLEQLCRTGLLIYDREGARLTEKGLDLANQVFAEFI